MRIDRTVGNHCTFPHVPCFPLIGGQYSCCVIERRLIIYFLSYHIALLWTYLPTCMVLVFLMSFCLTWSDATRGGFEVRPSASGRRSLTGARQILCSKIADDLFSHYSRSCKRSWTLRRLNTCLNYLVPCTCDISQLVHLRRSITSSLPQYIQQHGDGQRDLERQCHWYILSNFFCTWLQNFEADIQHW